MRTKKSALRVILGEFSRGDAKSLSDDEAVKILRKLIKSEQETLERLKKPESDSAYLKIVSAYLPDMAGDDEIRQWIGANIDFSTYKNKMQAIVTSWPISGRGPTALKSNRSWNLRDKQ